MFDVPPGYVRPAERRHHSAAPANKPVAKPAAAPLPSKPL